MVVNIEVDYTQIADADLSKLYYEIRDMNTGVNREIKDNPAVKIGTQRVIFNNVELAEGLNRITVVLDTVSKPRSLPAWIIYTALATVTDLKIDNRSFTNGIFVPLNNPALNQNTVFVDGTAPNATQVQGYTTLNPGGSAANFFFPQTGAFSFSAGQTNVDLRLRPGDNDMTIIGSNPFKTLLFRQPTFVATNTGGPFTMDLETDVKINRP